MRDLLLLPLLLGYMLCLVLATWPTEIRPSFLDGASTLVSDKLESVGIRGGLQVFGGTPEKQQLIIRSRCLVAVGTDLQGREAQLYPSEPCPQRGFRWKPVIYEHMLLHWFQRLGRGFSDSNLWAMGDHFCSLSPDRLQHVEITYVLTMIEYETGREYSRSFPVGRRKCRS